MEGECDIEKIGSPVSQREGCAKQYMFTLCVVLSIILLSYQFGVFMYVPLHYQLGNPSTTRVLLFVHFGTNISSVTSERTTWNIALIAVTEADNYLLDSVRLQLMESNYLLIPIRVFRINKWQMWLSTINKSHSSSQSMHSVFEHVANLKLAVANSPHSLRWLKLIQLKCTSLFGVFIAVFI